MYIPIESPCDRVYVPLCTCSALLFFSECNFVEQKNFEFLLEFFSIENSTAVKLPRKIMSRLCKLVEKKTFLCISAQSRVHVNVNRLKDDG